MSTRFVLAALIIAGSIGSSLADEPLDPLAPCGRVLSAESGIPEVAVGFWAFGYLDAATGEAHRITPDAMGKMREVLRGRCAAAPDARLIDIARAIAAAEAGSEPAIAMDGRALLEKFFSPSADHAAMTLALKPSPEDVRAVYAEPLAGKLVEAYEGLFVEGAAIRPKPGQTELLSTFTTTAALKRGDPVLGDFPGGYEDVLQFIVGDVPIARFKFVEPGETLGMAFDGLVHVNGRWVFMPKPWNVLN